MEKSRNHIRVLDVLKWLMRLYILFLAGFYLATGNLFNAMVFSFWFLATFTIYFLREYFRKFIHYSFDFLLTLAIFLHTLGTALGIPSLYTKIYFYDSMLHVVNSVIFTYFGFMILYLMNEHKVIKLEKKHMAAFAIMFTLSSGAVWEIGEFLWDSFVLPDAPYLAQGGIGSGLEDTMIDLMSNTFASILTAIALLHLTYRKKERILKKVSKK